MLGIHYAHDLKSDLGAFPGVIFRDLFGSLDSQDNDRNVCFLGDLEYTVMERKELAFLASGAFRVNEDGDLVGLEELAGAVDGHHGVSRVLAVNGHHAAAADDASVEWDLEVFGFRDERRIVFGEDLPGKERVEIRSVVADEEHLFAFRDLVKVDKIVLNAHDAHADRRRVDQKEAVELRVGVIFFLRIDKQRRDECKKEQQEDACDLDADDGENDVKCVK